MDLSMGNTGASQGSAMFRRVFFDFLSGKNQGKEDGGGEGGRWWEGEDAKCGVEG